jgi:uncharacterized protein (TIRG00374 family)
LLKLVISLALLALILSRVGWRETVQTLSGAHLPYLLAALAVHLVSIVGRALRWKVLVDALGMRFSLARLTELYFVGAFFSTFLPTEVGGDVVRAYEVVRHSDRPAAAVGTVLVDRATGLLGLFLMASFALAFSYSLVGLSIAATVVLLSVLSWGGAALLMQRGLLERLGLLRLVRRLGRVEEVYESIHASGLKAIAKALAVSLVLNVLLIAMNYLVARALGVTISVWYFVLFVPIVSVVLMLPVSLSGLGVREGAYVYLFAQAGVSTAQALTMSLLIYALRVVAGLVGGSLYALQGVRELRAQEAD